MKNLLLFILLAVSCSMSAQTITEEIILKNGVYVKVITTETPIDESKLQSELTNANNSIASLMSQIDIMENLVAVEVEKVKKITKQIDKVNEQKKNLKKQ